MQGSLIALLLVSLLLSCSPAETGSDTPPELRVLLEEYAGALESRTEALEQGDFDAAPASAVSAASILKRLQSEWRLTPRGVRDACSDAGVYLPSTADELREYEDSELHVRVLALADCIRARSLAEEEGRTSDVEALTHRISRLEMELEDYLRDLFADDWSAEPAWRDEGDIPAYR